MNEEGPLRKLVRWWRSEPLPQPPLPKPDPNCKHLKARVRGADHIGKAWCPECKASVFLSEAFDNLLKEMRKAAGVKEFKDG